MGGLEQKSERTANARTPPEYPLGSGPAVSGRTCNGTVISWKTEQGYGFVKNPAGGPDLFLHINDIQGKLVPSPGDRVRFKLRQDGQGKLSVYRAQVIRFSALTTMDWSVTALVVVAPFVFSLFTVSRSAIPLILYSSMSVLCFFMIRDDKCRAEQGRWRIPDDSIHLAQLLWGWPGSLLAQKIYFHKARKKSFQGTLHFFVFIHLIFWADYLMLNHLLLKRIAVLLQYLAGL
jgi:uncharacterized membrane protein YsdA (DUF1294 family)/cold shock CspA family protein